MRAPKVATRFHATCHACIFILKKVKSHKESQPKSHKESQPKGNF